MRYARDVIFLSVSYAKAHDGRLRYQFGPLNQQSGWRRLNVLITRARKEMRVFSSITADDFHLETTTSTGARLLRDFLAYAQRGVLDSPRVTAQAAVESEFERQVFVELSRRVLELIPQVGVSSYRIDFGVVDASVPERFVCGIECDGASYHRSETARDRDRLRMEVLERRGWTIHRLWSTDWFKDREGQADRLMRLVQATRERAQEEARQPSTPTEETPGTHAGGERPTAEDGGAPRGAYVRPDSVPYQVAEGERLWLGREILDAEGRDIDSAVQRRVQKGSLHLRGQFVWAPGTVVVPRSRAWIANPPAEQIAPEEYREAVLRVLSIGFALPKAQLIAETRSILGFSRTGARLEAQISEAIDVLTLEGRIGEGGAGIALRTSTTN